MDVIKELERFLQDEPIENHSILLEKMIEQIGSKDPYVRDRLIYRAFCKLVLDGHLDRQQLHHLFTTVLGEGFLHFQLGRTKRTRSSSAPFRL